MGVSGPSPRQGDSLMAQVKQVIRCDKRTEIAERSFRSIFTTRLLSIVNYLIEIPCQKPGLWSQVSNSSKFIPNLLSPWNLRSSIHKRTEESCLFVGYLCVHKVIAGRDNLDIEIGPP